MKFKILVFTVFTVQAFSAEPLLVGVLMVKNEAAVMKTTLQPLVDAGITDFLIYDTGSSDDTVQVTRDFFQTNNITSFFIEQEPWIDFSASRNRALVLAEQCFPQAIFMIMLDAEWTLQNGQALVQFCKEQKNSVARLYQIHISCLDSGDQTSYDLALPRLFRSKSNIRFIGKVHEIPNCVPEGIVPSNIYFKFNPTRYGKSKTEQRYLRDLDILKQEAVLHPADFRTAFFLAQTYASLGYFDQAIEWYGHSLTLEGSVETFFITFGRIADLHRFLGNEEKMIFSYLKAFELAPYRAEPLIHLAQYFKNKKNYELSFIFAQQAVTMPYPCGNEMQIEKWLYDFVRYDVLSTVAWHVGAYDVGLKATEKALAVCPDLKNLKQNLKAYQLKLSE